MAELNIGDIVKSSWGFTAKIIGKHPWRLQLLESFSMSAEDYEAGYIWNQRIEDIGTWYSLTVIEKSTLETKSRVNQIEL